jgi:O-antigen ligase
MLFLLMLLGAVLPLAIAPKLLFHYDVSPKTVVLGMVAAAALMRFRAIPEELAALWSRRGGRALVYLAVLQAFWISIASAMSTRPWFSLFGSGWRQFGLMTMIPMLVVVVLAAAHLCMYPARVTSLLRITVCAGLAASVYGVAQYFDLDPFQYAAIYHAQAGDSVIVRPPGTMGHADYFGWWLAIGFFCGLALARIDTAGIWRAVGIACTAGTGIAALLSGTRAAWLGIAIGALALTILAPSGFRRKHLIAATVLAGAAAVFYFSPAGTRLRARAAWSGEEPAGGARPLLWRDSLRMAWARPVFGFGPETFQSAFGVWNSEELARLYPDFHHESPHNVALDALTSEGVPGLLLVFGWGALAFQAAAAGLRVRSPLAPPLAAALVASVVAAIFDAAVLVPVLLTLLVVSMLIVSEPADVSRRISINPWFWRGICATTAVCIASFTVETLIADFKLARFQGKPGIEQYESARHWHLPGAAEDIYGSRVLLNTCSGTAGMVANIGCWRAAEQVAAEATRTADDPANAWYNLALFTAIPNDVRGTSMALNRAIQAAPNWFKPHWALARLLSRTGDLHNAVSEAGRAASLNANHDPEVSQTLQDLRLQVR